jgi:hypothetical protein
MGRLASLAVFAVVVLTGCAATPPATSPTPGASSSPDASAGATPSAPPSASPAGPLEALLPQGLGGEQLTIRSASGAAVAGLFESGDATALESVIGDINADIDGLELSLATSASEGSEDEHDILVAVFQLDGIHWTPYSMPLRELVQALHGQVPGHRLGTASVSGRNPTSILDPDHPEDQTYLYILREEPGDVVYFVNGAYPLVEELFALLPEGG